VEAVAAAKQLTTETGTSWYVVKARSQVDVVKVVELSLLKTYNKLKKFQNKLSECS
jgi:hypothetical protein